MSERRTVHRSFRLREDTSDRLARRAAETGQTYTTLAERFIDEGLRRLDHPGIDFWDEPSGRRARVVGTGMAVWEVILVFKANDESIADTADYLSIPMAYVDAAVAYHRAYGDEIDTIIADNDRAFEEVTRRYPAAWS